MEITINLIDLAVWVSIYYLAGFTLVFLVNFHRALLTPRDLPWGVLWKNLRDPMLYVAMPIWPYFVVTETYQVLKWRYKIIGRR